MNKNKGIITTYLEIRHRLSTFTIINCEHKNLFYRLIGHTAVVYKSLETGQLMVFESTRGPGVRLTPMGKWVSEYPGKVFVRIPTYSNIMCAQAKAGIFIRDHLGTSYPNLQTRSGRFKLYMAALDLKIFGKDIFRYDGSDEGIFCTMLVIMFLHCCGLMYDVDAQEWEPDDVRGGDIDMYLKNVKYGKEIRIK